MQNKLILRAEPSPFTGEFADITQNSVLSHNQMDGNMIYLKGQTIYTATTSGSNIVFSKLNGQTITVPSGGGGGETMRFGIEDANFDEDRVVFMNGHAMTFFDAGLFEVTGGQTFTYRPIADEGQSGTDGFWYYGEGSDLYPEFSGQCVFFKVDKTAMDDIEVDRSVTLDVHIINFGNSNFTFQEFEYVNPYNDGALEYYYTRSNAVFSGNTTTVLGYGSIGFNNVIIRLDTPLTPYSSFTEPYVAVFDGNVLKKSELGLAQNLQQVLDAGAQAVITDLSNNLDIASPFLNLSSSLGAGYGTNISLAHNSAVYTSSYADYNANNVHQIEMRLFSETLNGYGILEYRDIIASQYVGLSVSKDGVTIYDSVSGKGASYQANYAANNTNNPRWIPDKEYVDDAIDNLIPQSWTGTTVYGKGDIVYKEINSQTYQFISESDNNSTEPLLNSKKEAWSPYIYGGTFVGTWSAGTYTAGNIVNREGYAYYCLTNNNTDPILLSPPDWIKLGVYKGVFNPSLTYDNGDVVNNGSNILYLSNYDINNYTINFGIVSKWTLINGQPNTIIAWGDSLTFGAGSTGNSNYPAELSISSGINIDNEGVPGETSTQIKTRFLAAPEKWSFPTIIWAGRNNYGNPETVKDDIAEMISLLPHDKYLVLGIIKATSDGCCVIEDLNNDLKDIYGDKFIDMQSYLLNIYDLTIPQDVTDHADGDIAWSMRSDWLHLNNKGYYYAAKLVASKINMLLGQEYGYYNNLETGGLRITSNSTPTQDTEGVEILYRKENDRGYVLAYDRINSIAKDLSIGYSESGLAKLFLSENGGETYLGNPGAWTTDDITTLGRLNSNGRLLAMPTVPANYYPASQANGTFRQSLTYDNGNEVSVGSITPEAGFIFQVNGATRLGNVAGVSLYMGEFNSTTAFLQARDSSVGKNLQIFSNSLLVGPSPLTSTGEELQVGGSGKFTGRVKGADALNSNEFVTLGQITGSTEAVRFGIEDSGSTVNRAVDLDAKNLHINNVNEFNVIGGLVFQDIPYDDDTFYFEQTNTTGDPTYDNMSFFGLPNGLPNPDTIDITFTIDGDTQVITFTLSEVYGDPTYIKTPEIAGTSVTPISVALPTDTSKALFDVSEFEVRGKLIETVTPMGDSEQFSFNNSNIFLDIPDWNGYALLSLETTYNYDTTRYPYNVTVTMSVDGVEVDIDFVLSKKYSPDNTDNLYRWITPVISGTDVFPVRFTKQTITPVKTKFSLRDNTEGEDGKLLRVNSDGEIFRGQNPLLAELLNESGNLYRPIYGMTGGYGFTVHDNLFFGISAASGEAPAAMNVNDTDNPGSQKLFAGYYDNNQLRGMALYPENNLFLGGDFKLFEPTLVNMVEQDDRLVDSLFVKSQYSSHITITGATLMSLGMYGYYELVDPLEEVQLSVSDELNGKKYVLKNTTSHSIILTTFGTTTIDGGTEFDLKAGQIVEIICRGKASVEDVKWDVIYSSNSVQLAYVDLTGTTYTAKTSTKYRANSASLVEITLPSTGKMGEQVLVRGFGVGMFKIIANAGAVIHAETDTMAGGTLEATDMFNTITLEVLNITAGIITDWVVTSFKGVYNIDA